MNPLFSPIDFVLPDQLAAPAPPEERGLARDGVRLMVSRVSEDEIVHSDFRRFPVFLEPGDVLVVNTSATVNAAFAAVRKDAAGNTARIALHISHPLDNGHSVVELRRAALKGTQPLLDALPGEVLRLPGGALAKLIEPFMPSGLSEGTRLWVAETALPMDSAAFATRYGSPIRYSYVNAEWPLEYYQTIFGTEPGSAEMPSAGRAFTREIVDRLLRKGVVIAPLLLHTGVSSLESHEPPYPERYRVPAGTARKVNDARSNGRRVIAVGTTVVRALESVASLDGSVSAGEGWTDLVITPDRALYAVDGMLTGFHAPRASHLLMLGALADEAHLSRAYEAAVSGEYMWHEFGDLHLILS
jgi:S-adenosylmethionine:tRNA ribosyltransferase-isomerase